MFTRAQQRIIDEAIKIIRESTVPYSLTKTHIHSAKVAKEHAYLIFRKLEREEFKVTFLDSQNAFIDTVTLGIGTINYTPIFPREIVKAGINCNAAGAILMHNHPSGETVPSQADKDITEMIKKALDLIEIQTHDHLIVGGHEVYSFAENGLL